MNEVERMNELQQFQTPLLTGSALPCFDSRFRIKRIVAIAMSTRAVHDVAVRMVYPFLPDIAAGLGDLHRADGRADRRCATAWASSRPRSARCPIGWGTAAARCWGWWCSAIGLLITGVASGLGLAAIGFILTGIGSAIFIPDAAGLRQRSRAVCAARTRDRRDRDDVGPSRA